MIRATAIVALSLAALGCASTPKQEKPVLLGEVSREAVEAAVPEWVGQEVGSEVDAEAAAGLAAVPPGGDVTIFFGTWCGDSKREVSRFWHALDQVGGEVGFTYRLIGVSRGKAEPAHLLAGQDIRFVPTFIVRRDGVEVGRIVESSPHGIEVDLLDLLEGRSSGTLTLRDDLGPLAEAPPVP